jgi:MobA-like NTP transferase domain
VAPLNVAGTSRIYVSGTAPRRIRGRRSLVALRVGVLSEVHPGLQSVHQGVDPHRLEDLDCSNVLAAGESRRMGFDKTVAPLGLQSPLARVADALGRRRPLLVVPPHLCEDAARIAPAARIVVNGEQARGMAHSLHLALVLIERESPFGVLLGDMPSMTQATIERTEALLRDDIDVAFPADPAGNASTTDRARDWRLARPRRSDRDLAACRCGRLVRGEYRRWLS